MATAKFIEFPAIFPVLREFVHALVRGALWEKAATAVRFDRGASFAVPAGGAVVGTAELACGKTQTFRPPFKSEWNSLFQ